MNQYYVDDLTKNLPHYLLPPLQPLRMSNLKSTVCNVFG